MNSIFISGTDTGVGKTIFSSLLVTALGQAGFPVGYFKPVQTGHDLDTLTVSHLAGIQLSSCLNPVYQFPDPLSPHRAAAIYNQEIQIEEILKSWVLKRQDRIWVVEGAGGLLVPLNQNQTIRDLIQAMELRLILVASTRLGTINHTLLTLEAAKLKGIEVLGLVLVGSDDEELESVLLKLTQIPVLARIPLIDKISDQWIQKQALLYLKNILELL